MNTIPYGKQKITEEDIEAVVSVLRSDFLTQGPAVEEFERAFCKYVGCKYAVAVSNGTAALHLAAMALNVRPGDKVLSTPNSFVATTNCVLYCGADIEFIDIDPFTYCLDLDLFEQKLISSKPGTYKGIVAVDFAGYPMDFERLGRLARDHGLWIIEDSCHAIGAEFKDSKGIWQKCGNGVYADASVFSFHPVKHLTTGEGGMIATNDAKLYEKLKLLRTHGITKEQTQMSKCEGPWYYEMQDLGFNYRIPDLLCALGFSQLKRIESNLKQRKAIAAKYDKELEAVVQIPRVTSDIDHAYHLYVIQTDDKMGLYDHLRKYSIFPQVHYIPIHTQPYYRQKYGNQSFKIAEKYYSKALSLPMYHSMTDDEQSFVIEKIKQYFTLKEER